MIRKDFAVCLPICLAVVFSGLFARAEQGLCPPPNGEVYFPHENCSKFLVCDNGKLTELECPESLYFNPALGVCDYPTNVPECVEGTRKPDYTAPPIQTPPVTTSLTSTLPPTVTTEATTSTAVPTTPSHTTMSPSTTTAAPTTPIPTTIPPTTTETPSTLPPTTPTPSTEAPTTITTPEPLTSTTAVTQPPVDITTPLANGCPPSGIDKIPHPSSCDLYFICVNGRLNEIHCTYGLLYNPIKKECDYPQNVNCSSEHSTSTEILTTLTSSLPSTTTDAGNTHPPTLPECPAEGVSFHQIPGNCSWYLLCAEGFPVIQKCADGLCFNPASSKCEIIADSQPSPNSEHDAICNDNRDGIYLFSSRHSCKEYHICLDGLYRGIKECEDELLYNHSTQTCVTKELSSCNLNEGNNEELPVEKSNFN